MLSSSQIPRSSGLSCETFVFLPFSFSICSFPLHVGFFSALHFLFVVLLLLRLYDRTLCFSPFGFVRSCFLYSPFVHIFYQSCHRSCLSLASPPSILLHITFHIHGFVLLQFCMFYKYYAKSNPCYIHSFSCSHESTHALISLSLITNIRFPPSSSLASAGNELKLQATGSGLDDLSEEFMDGRIQYALARLENPNSNLEKFVQINWCGAGVPERQKGLFNTYSPQVANGFFKGASHLTIQARNEGDVEPDHIRKRVEESSGSKYTPGPANESQSKPATTAGFGAPRPYVPSSTNLQKTGGIFGVGAPPRGTAPAGAPSTSSSTTTSFQRSSAPSPSLKPEASTPTPFVPTSVSSLQPAATVTTPGSGGPPSAFTGSSSGITNAQTPEVTESQSSKPKGDDRIGPVGTAYTPVSLPAPKKLGNRWGAGAAAGGAEESENTTADSNTSSGGVGGFAAARNLFSAGGGSGSNLKSNELPTPSGKKLTWSERQAEAKKQREAEEKAAEEAMSRASGSGSIAEAATAGATLASTPSSSAPASAVPPTRSFGSSAPSFPSRTLPPPAAAAAPTSAPVPAFTAAPLPPRAPSPDDEERGDDDDDDWGDAPPPPPAPSVPAARPPPSAVEPEEEQEDSSAVPPPQPAADNADSAEDDDASKLLRLKQQLTLNEEPEVEADAPAASASASAPPPVPIASRPGAGATGGNGQTAKVVFDYEAQEDNEISLKEGEEISQIKQDDVGEWMSKKPSLSMLLCIRSPFPLPFIFSLRAPISLFRSKV